eukprot:1375729-Rhodomonas_salina.3
MMCGAKEACETAPVPPARPHIHRLRCLLHPNLTCPPHILGISLGHRVLSPGGRGCGLQWRRIGALLAYACGFFISALRSEQSAK